MLVSKTFWVGGRFRRLNPSCSGQRISLEGHRGNLCFTSSFNREDRSGEGGVERYVLFESLRYSVFLNGSKDFLLCSLIMVESISSSDHSFV